MRRRRARTTSCFLDSGAFPSSLGLRQPSPRRLQTRPPSRRNPFNCTFFYLKIRYLYSLEFLDNILIYTEVEERRELHVSKAILSTQSEYRPISFLIFPYLFFILFLDTLWSFLRVQWKWLARTRSKSSSLANSSFSSTWSYFPAIPDLLFTFL